jgi:hypothetical protein|tara:strand:- start:439 stop:822 length:384 start_codon:yes stop_codon:yes gene_type:complete
MSFRIITPRVHGLLDYMSAIVLILAPSVLEFNEVSPYAYWLSVIAGVILILYSLMTDYDFSIGMLIPLKTHLVIDFSAGVLFILWPFIFDFTGLALAYYLVMGFGILLVVGLTQSDEESQLNQSAQD